jgi:deoxycytidylate deaminase
MDIAKHSKVIRVLTEIAIATPKIAGAKIAAGLVYKNRLISVGVNSLKTSPFQVKYSANKDAIFLHAETAAIKNALRHLDLDQLAKASLYICRVKRIDNTSKKMIYGMTKPCVGCQRAIADFDIKNVWYTADESNWEML